MTKIVSILSIFCMVCSVQGSWYWPFDFDRDSTNKPPRLHRLLEKANDYIEAAESEALDGNGDKAIENYRNALAELDRVERENRDRAETPEFAPLRNKRTTCAAAIEAIRFAQVSDNERAVAVSDVSALRERWKRKHAPPAEKKKTADPVPMDKALADKLAAAAAALRKGDYESADAMLDGLDSKYPDSLPLALLRAAAQAGTGSELTARRTLEKAARAHPDSYLPLYNLASISLRLGEKVEVARAFYERGRKLGGPQNPALEQLLSAGQGGAKQGLR